MLRSYQIRGVELAIAAIQRGERLLLTAPTGCGKSYIINEIVAYCEENGIKVRVISPKVEILEGIYTKRRAFPANCSNAKKLRLLESAELWTPVKLRNRILKGVLEPADVLIVDEAHHGSAPTYEILAAVRGDMPMIGVTATGFRATPKETARLKEVWGDPVPILSWREAVSEGWVSMPTVHMVPIHDDDQVSIRGGDFQVTGKHGVNALIGPTLAKLVGLIKERWDEDSWRPTMISLPSTQMVEDFGTEAVRQMLPIVSVTQATSAIDREAAFKACVDSRAILVQINVVSEGVDLPIRVLWDCKPTMSPVAWQQQIGRVTRPSEEPPIVYCTNRNIERHGYLLEGLLPLQVVRDSQEGFGGPTAREGARRLGLEAMARFKQIRIPLANGILASGYSLQRWSTENGKLEQYFGIVLPCVPEPLFARKVNEQRADGTMGWGRWKRCGVPEDLTGFATGNAGPFTPKQRDWWKRDAGRFGLDDSVEVDKRTFSVLPVLCDLRMRIS